MLARTPRTRIFLASQPEKPKRLTKDRKRSIREKVVAIMRTAEPTAFAVEGACRAGIRSSLCLQGWKWVDADEAANEVVKAALSIVGAKRPTWQQGQPEWTEPGALPILRTRCIRCRNPLPEGHWKFCSRICGDAYHGQRAHLHMREDREAKRRARMAAWTDKQPERVCEHCKRLFKPRTPKQRFCSGSCVGMTYGPINGGSR